MGRRTHYTHMPSARGYLPARILFVVERTMHARLPIVLPLWMVLICSPGRSVLIGARDLLPHMLRTCASRRRSAAMHSCFLFECTGI
jgi:hypothetical protein